jgi:hypothetical protein
MMIPHPAIPAPGEKAGSRLGARVPPMFPALRSMLAAALAGIRSAPAVDAVEPRAGVVLDFPNNGYATLRSFARELRQRFANCGIQQPEPFKLEITGGSTPRLCIDASAFVEFEREPSCYRLIVQASRTTRVVVETLDFKHLDALVGQYIVGRITGDAPEMVGA